MCTQGFLCVLVKMSWCQLNFNNHSLLDISTIHVETVTFETITIINYSHSQLYHRDCSLLPRNTRRFTGNYIFLYYEDIICILYKENKSYYITYCLSLFVSIEVDRYNELFSRKESSVFLSPVTTFVC